MVKGWVVLIAIAICCTCGVNAQSLRGKLIYVSSSQPVKLQFGSRVTNYSFIERSQAALFKIDFSGKKNLSISTAGAKFKYASLSVSEGNNTHLFMLEFKEPLNASSELVYDFSSGEKLNEEVQKGKMVLNNASAREAFGKQEISTVVFSAGTPTPNTAVDAIKTEPPSELPDRETALLNTAIKDSVVVAKSKPNPSSDKTQSVKLVTEASNASKMATATSKPELKSPVKPATTNVSLPEAKNNNIPANKPLITEPKKNTVFKPESAVTETKKSAIPAPEPVDTETTEININEGYELLIHLGDSTAWIAKNFEASLRWYDSARKVDPQATYPRKQIAAVKQVMNEQLAEDRKERSAKFQLAMPDYKAADALRVDRKFDEAYKGYSKFLSQIDSTRLHEYMSSELHYINQAKDYLVRLQPHLSRPKVEVAPPPPLEDKKIKKKKKNNG